MKVLRHLLGAATLVAGIAGGFYIWNLLDSGGDPGSLRFTLRLPSAEGLRNGAEIKYRGVRVGEVRGIELDAGGTNAIAECVVHGGYRGTITKTSRFWVVRPRFRGCVLHAEPVWLFGADSHVAHA